MQYIDQEGKEEFMVLVRGVARLNLMVGHTFNKRGTSSVTTGVLVHTCVY